MKMEIDNMSTDTIKAYLEERKNKESESTLFKGEWYTFNVTGEGCIEVCSPNKGIERKATITSEITLLALGRALDLALERRGI